MSPRPQRTTTAFIAFGILLLAMVTVPVEALAGPAEPGATETPEPTSAATPKAPPDVAVDTASSDPAPAPAESDASVWAALIGQELRLTTEAESVHGKLLAHDAGRLVMSRIDDGLVVTVPASRVRQVHAILPRHGSKPVPTQQGTGLLVGGRIMVGFGIPISVIGAGVIVVCPGCALFYVPLLIPGVGLVAGGASMIHIGKQRRERWRKAMAVQGILPGRDELPLEGVAFSF